LEGAFGEFDVFWVVQAGLFGFAAELIGEGFGGFEAVVDDGGILFL
jgi:hypothetical protein